MLTEYCSLKCYVKLFCWFLFRIVDIVDAHSNNNFKELFSLFSNELPKSFYAWTGIDHCDIIHYIQRKLKKNLNLFFLKNFIILMALRKAKNNFSNELRKILCWVCHVCVFVWIEKHRKLIKISWNLRLFPRTELEIRRHSSNKYRWCYVKL